MKRTHQTVQGFIDSGIPWEQLSGLDEMAWGDYEGKAVSEETRGRFKKIMQSWKEGDLDVRFENGESPNEVQAPAKRSGKNHHVPPGRKHHFDLYARPRHAFVALFAEQFIAYGNGQNIRTGTPHFIG